MASLKLPLRGGIEGDEEIGHARIAAHLVSQAITIHLRHLGVRDHQHDPSVTFCPHRTTP